MTDIAKTLALLAALALAGPVAAQQTTEGSGQATAGADAGTAGTDGTEGEAAAAGADQQQQQEGPRVGQTYIKGTFGDWQIRCIKAESGKDPCSMYQLLKDQAGNAVAEMTLSPLPKGGKAVAGATLITPLETLLTQQVAIQVDKGQTKRYPFTFCNQQGCFVRMGLTAEDVLAFKRGNAAAIAVVPVAAPNQQVVVNASLTGFTAAYTALEEELGL